MDRNFDKQKSGGHFGLSLTEDVGYVDFVTTASTVELTTKLAIIKAWHFQVDVFTAGVVEQFYISTPSFGTFWYDVPGNGDIVITRAAVPIRIEGSASGGAIDTNNFVEAPIGVCPISGLITALSWYNYTKGGGSPLMEVGKVPSLGAGSANVDFFVDSADDSGSSHVPPASSVGKDIFALTADTNGSRVVAAGDLITLSTTGGTTSAPAGTHLSMEVTPNLTSGLRLSYRFLGL